MGLLDQQGQTAPNESDPWAWQAWSAQNDPGLHGWKNQRDATAANLQMLKPYLQQQGKWTPQLEAAMNAYVPANEGTTSDAGTFGATPSVGEVPLSSLGLTGYQTADARANGYNHLNAILGPDGKPVAGDVASMRNAGSWKSGDYGRAAGVVAGVLGAGYGIQALGAGAGAEALGEAGGYGYASGEAAGAGATELGGYGAASGGEGLLGSGPTATSGNTGMLDTGGMGQIDPINIPDMPAGPTGTVNGGNGMLGKAAEIGAGTAASKAGGGSDYSNEGGNYPTPESTQGAGGSPANTTGNADWLDSLKNYGGSAADWLKANPQAGRALAGLIGGAAGASGGGSGGGGYVDSGYRPTISRGGFLTSAAPQAQAAQPKPSGLLNMPAGPGYANSGLWRYGLLGGK